MTPAPQPRLSPQTASRSRPTLCVDSRGKAFAGASAIITNTKDVHGGASASGRS